MNTNTNAATTESVDAQILAAQAKVRRYEDALAEAKAELRTLRGQNTKAKTSPRACECGCGGTTSGGTFLPGHDAKMRSRLLTEIRDGESEESERAALATLQGYAKLSHGVGDWDLGRDRKAREQKEARKSADAQAKAEREKSEADAKAARQRMQERSREEMRQAGEQRLANKDRAIEAAKSGKM